MDDLAHFKGLLDQYEQTRKRNSQLEQEVTNLRERAQGLQEENDDLRAAVEYGQRMIAKNVKRDGDVQEVFSRALSRTVDRTAAADSHAQDAESTVPEIEDSQIELRDTLKPEVVDTIPPDDPQAVEALLAELPHEIGLVEEIAQDGTYGYHNHSLHPPAGVSKSLVEYVSRAHECRGRTKRGGWEKWFTSTHACAASTLWTGSTNWVDKIPGKYCCRGCFVQKRACVFFDHQAQKLAVLPLPPTMRPSTALPDTDEYYITTRDVNRRTKLPNGPWASEPTLKRDLDAMEE